MVLATQNPVEYEGTYPLPEAQLDRFMVRVQLGYPPANDEAEMLARARRRATGCSTSSRWPTSARSWPRRIAAAAVHASEPLRRYVVALLERTRSDARTELGA